MPHLRLRFAAQYIEKLAKLWPVVGVVGLRQSGKTTLMRSLFQVNSVMSFDDLTLREEAIKSPRLFLEKLTPPVVLDEVQKAPPLFDAIKMKVDEQRIPGSYFITGSSAFSAKIGIRESLTGRIGVVELFPLSLAEMHDQPMRFINSLAAPLSDNAPKPRFHFTALAKATLTGGMPIPAFLRDSSQRDLYWRSWLETSILRDLARHFPRGFNPDFAFSVLEQMALILQRGELPTLKHFTGTARKIRLYLSALEDIFILRKINCHGAGIGKEIWLFTDSGLATYLMGAFMGEGVTLSLLRQFIWNEICVQAEYQGRRLTRQYYKSAQGSPIDFIIDNTPFRIVANPSTLIHQRHWEERALRGAMKKLSAPNGYLIAPVDHAELPTQAGEIGVLPWTAWS